MSERLNKLSAMLEKTPNDPFLLYGIGMEHRKDGRFDEAIALFDRTLAADPLYCYAFYQKGQALEDMGRPDEARKTYQAGIDAARAKGDAHAEAELADALRVSGD